MFFWLNQKASPNREIALITNAMVHKTAKHFIGLSLQVLDFSNIIPLKVVAFTFLQDVGLPQQDKVF